MGWIRSHLNNVRRMKARLGEDTVTLLLDDGSEEKFTVEDFCSNFQRNAERLRALYKGDEVPPAHHLGRALSRAVDASPELGPIAEHQRRLDHQVESRVTTRSE